MPRDLLTFGEVEDCKSATDAPSVIAIQYPEEVLRKDWKGDEAEKKSWNANLKQKQKIKNDLKNKKKNQRPKKNKTRNQKKTQRENSKKH